MVFFAFLRENKHIKHTANGTYTASTGRHQQQKYFEVDRRRRAHVFDFVCHTWYQSGNSTKAITRRFVHEKV